MSFNFNLVKLDYYNVSKIAGRNNLQNGVFNANLS